MRVRDRKAAGLKAAQTNRSKSATYYSETGSWGGKAVEAFKRAFSKSPKLASSAGQSRILTAPGQTIRYVITPQQSSGLKGVERRTRRWARLERDEFKSLGYKSTIKQVTSDEQGLIIEERIVW